MASAAQQHMQPATASQPAWTPPVSLAAATTPLLHLLPGTVQACSNIAVGYPFDTMKTRLQLKLHDGVFSGVRELVGKNGPLVLYRGCTMPLASLVCKRPFEFAAWEAFKKKYSDLPGASFIGGIIAGFIGAFMGCPFSVVKIQMQSRGSDTHRNTFEAIRTVWRSRGIFGFYWGLNASIIMQVPYASVYLGTYGKLRETFPQKAWGTAAAGGIASIVTWSSLQPLDTVRTTIQASTLEAGQTRSAAWLDTARKIVAERGVRGLWAGWTPVAMRAVPTSGFSMLAYETTRSLADKALQDA
eukprot:TRINITY_DN5174_c0_g1_i1.p1 TRINITY_DN5174_c0_g1~~TRINITY_DN5174_c0_g1_i1.p1  ORF type:complete len:300 (-),score=30.63 TRINITY_DN5174_c0_g1_i1:67-966(-)